MPFTTPATAVAGTALTAAFLNTYVRDNIAWQATDSPACRAYNSSNFSHTTNANWMAVTLNSERYDNAAIHSTSSNTERFTIPSGGGGKYLMGCAGAWDIGTATGIRVLAMGINGISVFSGAQVIPGSLVATQTTVTTAYSLIATDYVVMAGYQTAGGTTSINVQNNYSPEAWVIWFRT